MRITRCGEVKPGAVVFTRAFVTWGRNGTQALANTGGYAGYLRNDPIRDGSRTDPGKATLKLERSVQNR